MDAGRVGASLGFAAVQRAGPMPRQLDRIAAWARRELGAAVRLVDAILPECPQLAGLYHALAPDALPGVTGLVLARRDAPDLRWVLGHELGHHLAGCACGMLLQQDGRYHADLPGERTANAAAAMLLVPLDGLVERWEREWTRCQIAAYYGVPPAIVSLRGDLARALGERVDGADLPYHVAVGA